MHLLRHLAKPTSTGCQGSLREFLSVVGELSKRTLALLACACNSVTRAALWASWGCKLDITTAIVIQTSEGQQSAVTGAL